MTDKAKAASSAKKATPAAPEFEVPTSIQEMADKSLDQAKEAYGKFRDAAKEASGLIEDGAAKAVTGISDVNLKAIDHVQNNINSSFDFAKRIVGAKNPNEFIELQTEFFNNQIKSLNDQAKEFGELSNKYAQEISEPVRSSFLKSMDQFKNVLPK